MQEPIKKPIQEPMQELHGEITHAILAPPEPLQRQQDADRSSLRTPNTRLLEAIAEAEEFAIDQSQMVRTKRLSPPFACSGLQPSG